MSGVAVTPDKEAEMYESFCVFKTEPKNTCLRCRLGAISNNRAPRFSRWELESVWLLFSRLSWVPGDQGVTYKDQCWGLEGSPRGTLASCSHPAVAGDRLRWDYSKLFQIAKDAACQRALQGPALSPLVMFQGDCTVLGRLQKTERFPGARGDLKTFQLPLLVLPFLKWCLHPMVVEPPFP